MRLHQFLLYILLCCWSCVEHKYVIHVSPDGAYMVNYTAHGDRNDLVDEDVPLPTGEGWVISSTLDGDAESYDYTAIKFFEKNQLFPATFYKGDSLYTSSLLSHPISITHSHWGFTERFELHGKLGGRGVHAKYPKLLYLFKDDSLSQQGFLFEIISYLFTETLHHTPIEFNQQGMVKIDLEQWLHQEIKPLPDSTLLTQFDEIKEEGLDILMQPISPDYYHHVDSLFTLLEDEARITMDLMDDTFSFQAILPGELMSTNADTTYGDTLAWKITWEDYHTNDIEFIATSKINHPQRLLWGILIMSVVIILVLLRKRG